MQECDANEVMGRKALKAARSGVNDLNSGKTYYRLILISFLKGQCHEMVVEMSP
jgi:hypothetical protein